MHYYWLEHIFSSYGYLFELIFTSLHVDIYMFYEFLTFSFNIFLTHFYHLKRNVFFSFKTQGSRPHLMAAPNSSLQ